MNNILTGAAMGAALTTAGVYAPDIILSQFNFTDFTMLQTFLSAAAGSTYVFLCPLPSYLSAPLPIKPLLPLPSHYYPMYDTILTLPPLDMTDY
jgi:hypothetical protein